jgi:undecaprenyl diphosphate synthase
MDGNGRWAKLRGKNRTFGHLEGVKTADKIISYASNVGIKFLTLYVFSTENWKRSKIEVEFLMNIFKKKLEEAIDRQKRNIKFRVIGEKEGVSNSILNLIHTLEEKTKLNTGMILNIAFNYGAQSEILNSFKLVINDLKNKKIDLESINKENFDNYLYTQNQPDVDLLIRTGGEFRLSNFLLWQVAYAELFFTKTFWPDFSEKDLESAILEFNKRERRYGGAD